MTDPVFVFGSNLQGRHGKGAAHYARMHHGAVYGQAEGLQGNSYGIPTRTKVGAQWQNLPLDTIKGHVETFLAFAKSRPDLRFQVTRIGCGLAGYTDEQIAPMFEGHSPNCIMPDAWKDWTGFWPTR